MFNTIYTYMYIHIYIYIYIYMQSDRHASRARARVSSLPRALLLSLLCLGGTTCLTLLV